MSVSYRRDYVRPCRECGHPIVGAARNQRMHGACRSAATARRVKIARECRRAARGLFPFEKKPIAKTHLNRRPPTARTRSWYRWHTCSNPYCGVRFLAGWQSEICPTCQRARARELGRRRDRLRRLRAQPRRVSA